MRAKAARLRDLPSVDALLAQRTLQSLLESHTRDLLVDAVRAVIDSARHDILAGQPSEASLPTLAAAVERKLARSLQPSLKPVINATGIIIHTNLGRAPLSPEALNAMNLAGGGYSNLEYDLGSGGRGSRLSHASSLLRDLTGAEDALVVNNNASALILILSALAQDREVIISRGQLVEIGGGFRIPAIMQESGARLLEVGTTNRTRLADFAEAISERTAMLLRAHASNFKQIGFVENPQLGDLARLGRQHGILTVDDLGSGALIDTAQFGLDREPMIQESIAAGVDLLCFSGDKLLGGPQAGIILGRADLIARLKHHPLARAMRVGKLTYAALLATLLHYRRGEALRRIPVWRMIAASLPDIEVRAGAWASELGAATMPGESAVGGGSLPGAVLPTALLALETDNPDGLTAKLRQGNPPLVARIADGRVLLDPRTVLPEEDADLLRVVKAAV